MKRILLVILALTLCLSALPAFADSNVNINVDAGDHSPVNVNVNSIDGCNNDAVINDGTAGGIIVPVKPGKTPTCILINGVPGCIEPSDYCGPTCCDPDRRLDDPRHVCLKDAARNAWNYLESQLKSIGWWYYGTHKFVWSSGTRVIYGRSGDNNHYKRRHAVTFYYKGDSSIRQVAYFNVYISGDDFVYLFSEDFLRISKCEKWEVDYAKYYPETIVINGSYTDAHEAVDAFIEYLEPLSDGE